MEGWFFWINFERFLKLENSSKFLHTLFFSQISGTKTGPRGWEIYKMKKYCVRVVFWIDFERFSKLENSSKFLNTRFFSQTRGTKAGPRGLEIYKNIEILCKGGFFRLILRDSWSSKIARNSWIFILVLSVTYFFL